LTTGFYYDLLGRAPAASEVHGWVSALQSGLTPHQEALAFTSSREYQSNLIIDDYWNLLKRGPGPAEVNGWFQTMQGGLGEQQVKTAFLSSPEYYQDQGNNPTNWLSSLYQNVLHRTPSGAELAGWNQVLQNGTSRAIVAMGFVNSQEAHSLEVTSTYERLLGRNPDLAGLAIWVAAIGQGLTPSALEAQFAASQEYVADQGLTAEAPATFNTGSNPGLHFELAFDNSPVAAGYTKVPVVNYTSTRGYGWLDITGLGGRDRSTTDPLTSNFETGTDGTFLVDLPNGVYTVAVSLGDAAEMHDNVSVWGNGALLASGLTTTTGQFIHPSYRVQATNGQLAIRFASQGSVNPTFAINALDIAPASANSLTLSPTTLASATVNSAYSATLSATGGSGIYAFAVTSGSLPSWLSLNAATGVLSGTPTTAGASTFTITATDSQASGLTGSQGYTLTANPGSSLTFSPATLPSATANSAYSATLSATGGSGTYTFAVTTGSLPSGLTLNTTTGALSGTPTTAGSSPFTITASDGKIAGLIGSQAYTLLVNAPVSVDPAFYTTPAVIGAGVRTINVSPGTTAALQQALGSAQPGDTIVLGAGTYTHNGGNLVISRSGTSSHWIVIQGAPGSMPVIDLASAGELTLGASFVVLENVEIIHGYGNNLHISPVSGSVQDVIVRNCRIHALTPGVDGAAIKINRNNPINAGISLLYLENNDLSQSVGNNAIVDAVGASQCVVRGNDIHDNVVGSPGIFFKGGSNEILIEKNLIRGIRGHAALLLGGWTSPGYFNPAYPNIEGFDQVARNNLITDCDDACVQIAGVQHARVEHNTIVTQTSFVIFRLTIGWNSAGGTSDNSDIQIVNNVIIATGGNPQYARDDANAQQVVFGNQLWAGGFTNSSSPGPGIPVFPQPGDVVVAPSALATVVVNPSPYNITGMADALARFALVAGSPAKAAGSADPLVPTDITGAPRSPTAPSLGAFE
jgi:hypothetical protein